MRWSQWLVVSLVVFPIALQAQEVDRILIDKSARTLALMSGDKTLKTYRSIKLGDAPYGHKQFEGDEKTPEGEYRIDGRNGGSRFHLSLRISYPNAADRENARRAGRSPGGDIFIHGQPNGSALERLPFDWTDGCIALSNREIEELWKQVKVGTRVTLQP